MGCMICSKSVEEEGLCKTCKETVRESVARDREEAERMGLSLVDYMTLKSKFYYQ